MDELSFNGFGTQATGTTIITPPETITETLQASVTTTSSSDPSTSSTSLTSPQSAETKSSSTSAVCYPKLDPHPGRFVLLRLRGRTCVFVC